MSNKLEGFGPVYILNLERSPERRAQMLAEFEKHGITDFSFISAIDGTLELESQNVHIEKDESILSVENACAASHLMALEHWLSTSDSLYAIFFEDDISFELVEKWKFSWEEVIQQLPEGCTILQMCPIRTFWETNHIELRPRDVSNDWGAGAYVIRRDYAQHLVSQHIKNEPIKTFFNMALSENILFYNPNAYVYSLFVETEKNETTMVGRDHAGVHVDSRNKVLKFWN
jgi:GR25 family glycosyltransferase involved in LPS biosynthesis